MKQQIRFCNSADGTRIAYAISGEGPPLVMTANWLTHLEHAWQNLAWRPWLEYLSQHYCLVRYDSRGCGLSEWDTTGVSLAHWVNDVEAVVDAAGLDRFAVLGVCQGGPIGIELAVRYPERVTRLVLYGTYAVSPEKFRPETLEKVRAFGALAKLGWGKEDSPFMQAFAALWQPDGSREHLRSWSELQYVTTSVENMVRLQRASINIDVREAAKRVRCPTLVIHADGDAVIPAEMGRMLASLVPQARYVELPTRNHMMLPEELAWSRFCEEITSFIPGAARAMQSARFRNLTARESEVLERLAQGLDNAQIAAHLGLSEKTVRNNVSNIFDKLGVENRSQAIVLARDSGLGRG